MVLHDAENSFTVLCSHWFEGGIKEKEREELVKKGTIGRGWAVGEEKRGSFTSCPPGSSQPEKSYLASI